MIGKKIETAHAAESRRDSGTSARACFLPLLIAWLEELKI